MNGSATVGDEFVARSFAASVDVTWTPSTRTFEQRPVVYVLVYDELPVDEWPAQPTTGFFRLAPFDLTNGQTPNDFELLAADPMHLTCPPRETVLGEGSAPEPIPTDSGYVVMFGIITEDELLDELDMTIEDAMEEIESRTPEEWLGPPRSSCPQGDFWDFIR